MDSPNPFRKGTVYYEVFALAAEGTTLDEITSLVKRRGHSPEHTLRVMRRGRMGNRTWQVEEYDGRFKVIYIPK